ncbi:hypothetical protein HDC92_001012 [Pedobacter sp. AK017]|uniref:hypothetical protein n=1 Tax=Pedobacter sp. AK017 TaxID=2723073 RepID=UPI00161D7945|nr:hypothetical protein [Pedobacter sp. AK017]MBB5437344.1 hypothetical protein [Pedobacter sp. AK017]
MLEKTKMIPFDQEPALNTETLMANLGMTRQEANALLWKMFDDGVVDLIPELNEEKLS